VFKLHLWYLEFQQVKLMLGEGKIEDAWRRLDELERRHRFTLVGQSQRVSGTWVRANVALARAATTPSVRDEMLAQARALARRLERERVPWVAAIARTVRATIADVAGDQRHALELLAEAEPLLEAHHLEAVLAVSRLVRGQRVGGEAGREAVARAEAWMAAEHVAPSVSRVLLPGTWSI
jgi:hypothetical protein